VSNWYIGREAVKAAVEIKGADADAIVDRHIEAASRRIDKELGRRFIPWSETRYFRWPQDPGWATRNRPGQVLLLDEDLLAVDDSGLKSENGTVTVPDDEYFLEPVSEGPPYSRIEIDQATTDPDAGFAAGDTPQRAIQVTGSWGYCEDTVAAGTVASGLASDAAATTFVCSDGSLVHVGHTLLIESEQLFVSGRGTADTGCDTNGALTGDIAEKTVTVTDGTKVKAGEVILINAERMYVESVSGNDLSVRREYDGTALAAHEDAQDVYAFRTLTVVRGVNGTTAATHENGTAINRYAPPADIVALCLAVAIANYEADKGGRTGVVGGGEGAVRMARDPLAALWETAKRDYGRSIAKVL